MKQKIPGKIKFNETDLRRENLTRSKVTKAIESVVKNITSKSLKRQTNKQKCMRPTRFYH